MKCVIQHHVEWLSEYALQYVRSNFVYSAVITGNCTKNSSFFNPNTSLLSLALDFIGQQIPTIFTSLNVIFWESIVNGNVHQTQPSHTSCPWQAFHDQMQDWRCKSCLNACKLNYESRIKAATTYRFRECWSYLQQRAVCSSDQSYSSWIPWKSPDSPR